eukprot:12290231-Alexandrium_andersonii.AAC.1
MCIRDSDAARAAHRAHSAGARPARGGPVSSGSLAARNLTLPREQQDGVSERIALVSESFQVRMALVERLLARILLGSACHGGQAAAAAATGRGRVRPWLPLHARYAPPPSARARRTELLLPLPSGWEWAALQLRHVASPAWGGPSGVDVGCLHAATPATLRCLHPWQC